MASCVVAVKHHLHLHAFFPPHWHKFIVAMPVQKKKKKKKIKSIHVQFLNNSHPFATNLLFATEHCVPVQEPNSCKCKCRFSLLSRMNGLQVNLCYLLQQERMVVAVPSPSSYHRNSVPFKVPK